MKVTLLVLATVLLGLFQQQPKATPPKPTAAETKAPELTDKQRADILAMQLKIAQQVNEYNQLQQRMQEIQKENGQANIELSKLQAEAMKEVDAKKWRLNPTTLKFEPTEPVPAK